MKLHGLLTGCMQNNPMPRTITALQIQKRNKERVNVFLDGEFAFAVNIMRAAELRKGQELTASEVEALQVEDERQTAYQKALRFLGHRPRSQREVEQRLAAKAYTPDQIAYVVQRLREEGYLDDVAFAQYWRENRDQFRPRSARALRYELRQKGVDKQVIDETLADADDEAAAWAAIEPKLGRWQGLDEIAFGQKVLGFLARRGFGHDVARRIMKRAWSELGGESEEIEE
jgi:regulatory protein